MDILLLLQACMYFCIFICGFLVCVPVGVNRARFGGTCILYGEITVGTSTYCDFPIYFGISGMITAGLLAGLLFGYMSLKFRPDSDDRKGLWTVLFIPLNAVLAIMTLVTVCIISVGIKEFCDKIEENLPSCSDLENIDIPVIDTNTGEFLTVYAISQAGGWIGFLLYVVQTGISARTFFQNRRQAAK